MQFMDNHTRGDKPKRYRATVQLGADYSQFTDAIPAMAWPSAPSQSAIIQGHWSIRTISALS